MKVAKIPESNPSKKRTAVLASGRGSNFEALLKQQKAGKLPFVEFALCLSNKPSAPVLELASNHDIPTEVVDHREFNGRRADHDRAILDVLKKYEIDFVVLAGYMRVLSPFLAEAFEGRMINIHPSLLPSFPGLDAQGQALAYAVKYSGCTVHYVNATMDDGPIIAQSIVPVLPNDTHDTLAERILEKEHVTLPFVVDLHSRERLIIDDRAVRVLPGESSYPELAKDLNISFPILVATGNAHKVIEISEILQDVPLFLQPAAVTGIEEEPEEDADDYLGNAQIKARFWMQKTGAWTMADDSGLEVDALDGRPGLLSSRYAETSRQRNEKLLTELKGVSEEKRTARFVCTVVLCSPDGEVYHATGKCEGKIAMEEKGDQGFGYDPVFIPDGFDGKHLAELSPEVKNGISHRSNALKGLREKLLKIIS